MSNQDDNSGASRTQTAVIEETVAQMMRALMAVHNDRSGGSQDKRGDVQVSEDTHRRLQMRLLATLDFFGPYSDQTEKDWSDIGPKESHPNVIRQRVREGETTTVIPQGVRDPDPEQVQQPALVDIRILEETARDLLDVAEELGFYPSADASRRPIAGSHEGLPTSEAGL